jgi:hypothetical protein
MVEERSNIVAFASPSLGAPDALREEAAAFAEENGADAYTDFILKHGFRPERSQAAAIGKLIGRRVRAADGSLQPSKSKAERAATKKTRQIEKDEERIDADLNRAVDAIALLAQNECDPIALIHRMSTMEEEEITANIEKAVEWIQRFTNHWRHHVQNGIIQTQNAAAGDDGQARTRGLHLVRESDCGG